MTDRQRIALFGVFLAALLFLGLLFAPFVIEHILKPLSVAVWLFLRIFVLSIGQQIYWGIFILIALIWLAHRLVVRRPVSAAITETAQNDAVLQIGKWFNGMTLATHYPEMRQQLRNELIQLLVDLFCSRQQETTYPEVLETLRQRKMHLPDDVYDFLFPRQGTDLPPTFIQRLRALPELPSKWWRKWSGQDIAECRQSIANVLNMMENKLENPDDDESQNHNNH